MRILLFLRRAHLWLGCLFAPLLIYFCLSGAWQTLGLDNGKSKEGLPHHLHQLSKPHTWQTWPAASSGKDSTGFKYFATAMALGMTLTALLGIQMAFKTIRPRWKVALALLLGFLVPLGMLWVAAH